MTVVSISKRGEIVIPKKLRETIGLEAGSSVEITVQDKKLVIEPSESIDTVMDRWEAWAKKYGTDMSDYDSDKAYEEMMEERNVRRR